MACMLLNSFNAKLQRFVGSKSKVATAAAAATNEKRNSHILQISAPFNFKRESIRLPGLSEDDIAILKEKAAASRLGDEAGIVNDSPSAFTKPRKAPPAPPSPVRTVVPAILVTPNTPLTPKDNAI